MKHSDPSVRRRAELAKIHVGAKQLGLDEATYRTMLRTVGGADSAGALDSAGRRKVLDHLRKAGLKAKRRKRVVAFPGTPHNMDRLPSYVAKVEALLTDMGLPWAYADAIARNITGGKGGAWKNPGVERLAWVKREEHWVGIIAALHVEQEKRGMLASVDALLEKLGEDHAYVDAKLPEHARGKWQRNRRYLRFVINLLQSDVKS